MTLSFKKENLPKAKELIRKFAFEFDKLMDADAGDEVYQLNIQFIPLTKKVP